ncbi:MAG: hypothetical protein RDU14_09510 [Melioribacteraceae bacterium]|nr:hypothetical protein [Melioribacteraceae bacterium]
MLKINLTYLKLVICFLPFLVESNFAQPEVVKQRRAIEHQQVRDFLNYKYSISPFSTNSTSTKSEKYSLRNMMKAAGDADRKSFFMNGNNVSVEIENYGGIAPGYGGIREITNLIWRDAPYIFQFCPIVGASVVDTSGKRIHIITDGMNDYDRPGLREIDPATGFKWQWQPLPGYADPNQPYIASNPAFDSDRDGKPDSWPREWYNEFLGQYVWPGYLTQGENNADLEAYWAMDDRDNKEFGYYPFNNDKTRKGIGVQVDSRAFQWSNSLASNAIFFVWSITNVSDKHLDSLMFGIYGDPDIGGADNKDDNGLFISPFDTRVPLYARNMVYFFDPDGIGDAGRKLGYLGCKFLESPGNPDDGIDNDGDGMIDERQDNNIDEDGDWNPDTDDVGMDGIPNTGDFGEGDGIPTLGKRLHDGRPDPLQPGEPNFGYTDLDESDQIGLTSFKSSQWATDLRIAYDEDIWNATTPGSFSEITQNEDIVFIFSSSYISLAPGETKRISMAFLFGEDLNDLLTTAETVQDIYNKNYRFFRPPSLPKVTAVADDKKVTLFWDSSSEESIDPITGKDFEGYVIYRSTRPDFADIQTITDGRGARFLYSPLKDLKGFDAKWDLNNSWKGYHPVPYMGRGLNYYLGDNSGLVHSFVDSNQVRNGQTYYYAVVAYDHGDSLGIPPSETTKKISSDPITSKLIFDDNTVQVIPGPRTSGYNRPDIKPTDVQHISGIGNGEVSFSILNDLKIKEDTYILKFRDTLFTPEKPILAKNYSVTGEKAIKESFYLYGTKFTNLSQDNIINDATLQVTDASGKVFVNGVDYELNIQKGQIKRTDNSTMKEATEYFITYKNYKVYQSRALNGEDSNPVFDGVLLRVKDYPALAFDNVRSKWSSGIDLPFRFYLRSAGNPRAEPADYVVTFSNVNISTAKKFVVGKGFIDIPVKYKVEDVTSGVPVPVVTNLQEAVASNDSAWTVGEEIVFYRTGSAGGQGAPIAWSLVVSASSTTPSRIPGPGDVLFIYTKRPYTTTDVFKIQTQAGFVKNEEAANKLDNIYVVPNPYVGTNEIEPANKLQGQNRGERRIYFENLPMKCTIRIYTLNGELVTTLYHDSTFDNGREFWNLLNSNGFSVAYGVYLAHIDAPEIGEKLIKFALIK